MSPRGHRFSSSGPHALTSPVTLQGLVVRYGISVTYSRRGHAAIARSVLSWGGDALKEGVEVAFGEIPLERCGDLLVVAESRG
jgi:hypothetical protein